MNLDLPDLTMMLPLLFMAGAAVVIGIFAARAAAKRRERLAIWAASRNWQYIESVPALVDRWQSPPFGNGHSRSATDVLAGEYRGQQVTSFQYRFVTGSGKNQSTHRFHVVAVHLPIALPWLQLTAQSGVEAVAKFFGGQDIEFESAEFNDAWRVKGPPGPYAFDVIHPRMMELLMHPGAVGQSITIEGADMYLYAVGAQSEQYIDGYLNLLTDVIANIPRHVWDKAGLGPQA